MCGPNEKVAVHLSAQCPTGKTITGGHDALGDKAACEATMYLAYCTPCAVPHLGEPRRPCSQSIGLAGCTRCAVPLGRTQEALPLGRGPWCGANKKAVALVRGKCLVGKTNTAQ